MSKRSWENQYCTVENYIKRCNICANIFHKNEPIVNLQQHITYFHPTVEVQTRDNTRDSTNDSTKDYTSDRKMNKIRHYYIFIDYFA